MWLNVAQKLKWETQPDRQTDRAQEAQNPAFSLFQEGRLPSNIANNVPCEAL